MLSHSWLSRTWTRIALSYVVLILLTAGVLAFLLGGELEAHEEAALRARLADQAHAVAFDASPLFVQQAPVTATISMAHSLSGLFGTRVTLIRPDGVVVGDSEEDPALMENHATRPEVVQVLSSSQPGTAVGSSSRLSATVHRSLLYVAVAVMDRQDPAHLVGIARVAYPLTSVEQARDALWGSVALAVLLVSLPAVLLGILLARSIVGPLTALRQAAYKFGKGDLSTRSPASGGEIGELSSEFNLMAEGLSDTIRRRTFERNEMAAVLAHMHDGILITDAGGMIQGMNAAAAELFGTSVDRASGRSLIEVTHNHELHTALHAALAHAGGRQKLEVEAGGRKLAVVVTAVPMPPDAEQGAGSSNSAASEGASSTGLVVVQDVSELYRLERARRDFVANIGHELRTPLTSIKLLVETLTHTVRDDPDATQDFLRRIDVEIDGLTQLVRELLELSRIESGQVELHLARVELPELLERAAGRLSAQAERAGVDLSVQVAHGLPAASADPERVEQVLVNLLHNAIKFNHPGGSVVLSAQAGDGGMLQVSVADTGSGIPSDDLPRIFERFYKVDKARSGERQREGGTGLGLAIAKHIVQAHGGKLWAESSYGQGSTFLFTLPAAGAVPVPQR